MKNQNQKSVSNNETKQIQNSVLLTEKLKEEKKPISKIEVERGKKAKDISLSEIETKIKNLQISEKYKKTKSFVYKFQLNDRITDVEQKKKRNSIRRSLERHVQNCLLEFKKFYELKNVKTKDVLNETLKAYIQFVKDNYIVENILSQTNFLSLEEKKQTNIFALIEFLKFEIQNKNQSIIDFIKKSNVIAE